MNNHFAQGGLTQQLAGNNVDQIMEDNEEDEEEDAHLPGLGHRAMPTNEYEIDQEIHEGDFIELANLMQPLDPPVLPDMDINSELTISLGSNNFD